MSLPIEVNPNMLGGLGGYQISRSVRTRSSASGYFNRTFGSGSGTTSTLSVWIKRGALGVTLPIMFVSPNATEDAGLQFQSDNTLLFSSWNGIGGRPLGILTTTQVFRDPSAWYHIVFTIDTGNATSTDRLRLYVNGSRITAFSTATYPSQNATHYWNLAYEHRIARYANSGGAIYFDGYLTEINFIGGQALTPSSFGETNPVTGVWQPKKYTGTYGTNGFYLNFSDNSSNTATTIGKDYSGNGNNWTPNNISVTAGSTYDSMDDTPSNNFPTLSPLELPGANGAANRLSNANLTISNASGSNTWQAAKAPMSMDSGLWYAEVVVGTVGSAIGATFGVTSARSVTDNPYSPFNEGFGFYWNQNNYFVDGVSQTGTPVAGDVIQLAFDATGGRLWFGKNNVWYSGNPSTLTSPSVSGINLVSPMFEMGTYSTTGNAGGSINFGQRPFTYTPPSGFKALNTQNLPAPTIAAGAKHMAATTYTGTGSSLSVTNTTSGLSFQPDLVWIKSRSAATDHALYDVLRGTQARVESNTVDAEVTADNGVTAFGSNGFTVNTLAQVNTNAATYVGWQWKANGAGVTNTAGSITSTVSANTTAGFSVVTYTGNGTNGATVGHGLGVAPQMMLVKRRNSNTGWAVYSAALNVNGTYILSLESTAAQIGPSASWFNSTAPTSSVFSLGTDTALNANTGTYVAYCFAPIAGFSAFGSYTGNGSTDGPFVYTGFRPRWILVKRTDTAGLSWQVFDTSRDDINVAGKPLSPNAPDVEANAPPLIDILSNGFKLRIGANTAFNANGGTYIYAAFAESPFKYALAR